MTFLFPCPAQCCVDRQCFLVLEARIMDEFGKGWRRKNLRFIGDEVTGQRETIAGVLLQSWEWD